MPCVELKHKGIEAEETFCWHPTQPVKRGREASCPSEKQMLFIKKIHNFFMPLFPNLSAPVRESVPDWSNEDLTS